MQLTGAEILINIFLEQGVDCVFGYPGGSVLNIYDELYKAQDKTPYYHLSRTGVTMRQTARVTATWWQAPLPILATNLVT